VEEELGIGVIYSARRPPAEARDGELGVEERLRGCGDGVSSRLRRLLVGVERRGASFRRSRSPARDTTATPLLAHLLDGPSQPPRADLKEVLGG
jgi:hypothetical protein